MADLESLRDELQALDDPFMLNLMEYLAARREIVKQVAAYKIENNMAAEQPEQFHKMKQQRAAQALEYGQRAEVVVRILTAIHEDSLADQREAGV